MTISQTAGTSAEPATASDEIAVTAAPADPRQLEAEIERTREQLGETVQELAYRADVKSRARAKAAEVSGRLKGTTAQARKVLTNGTDRAREHWVPLAAAAGVLTIGFLALSQWMRQHSASQCSR